MRFKLVRVVSPLDGGKLGTIAFPPISLGILARHLRGQRFEVDQDDLHRRWYSAAGSEEIEHLRSLSTDDAPMWRYLSGTGGAEWDWFGDRLTELSAFSGYDGFLLSMISSDIGCCVATLAFARYLKRRFAKPIVLGGEYHAYAPIHDELDRVLATGVLDYYVTGFGEEPLARLLGILSGRTPHDRLCDVPGLCFVDDGRVQRNQYGLRHPLVPPDFTGLPIDLYRWTAECAPPDPSLETPRGELTLPFHTSTGCPYDCSFCECSGMRKMSILPPERVVAELARLVEQHNCRTFFFLDNTLNISPRYINELCDRIIDARLDIQWMDCASGRGMDRSILEKMRRAGVIRIVWGLESGSERILEYVRKPVRLAQMSEVFRMSHEAGIWNGVECIVGMPSETEEEFHATMDFLEANAGVLDEVWCYQFYLNSVSDMLTNHDRYGLTNVRRVNVGLAKDAVYASVAATHVFDEVDGLSWPEKDVQQKRRLGEMLEHIARLGLYPMTWEHEQQPNLLSWCYRQKQRKQDVRELYRAYWQKLALHRTWSSLVAVPDTPEQVALGLSRAAHGAVAGSTTDDIWRDRYPDRWASFFPESEITSDLTYERRLLIDGRYHDSLVYARLGDLLAAPTGGAPA